ncbi:MAG: hypothetical protein WAV46_04045 [Candidatus Moraniibacteriota bacterium]
MSKRSGPEWSAEEIAVGFQRFLKENKRLPRVDEIDKLNYLPSARQIQRKFGGIEKLRSQLGYTETHFGKGLYRTEISKRVNTRGRLSETELEVVLKQKFHEVFVHTEKIFCDLKNRVDFYIYSPSGNFGIDVFSTDSARSLQGNVNVKIDKYRNFKEELYFVVSNLSFSQSDIDRLMSNKKKGLPINVRVVSLDELQYIINKKESYSNPIIQ